MEMYILDSLLRRGEVVDKFESLIWTERFQEWGDFELNIQSTRESRGRFLTGTLISVNTSWRVMVVETVENTVDGEGRKLLNVKGRSLELILEDRVAKSSLSDLTVDPAWTLTGTPGNIARKIFDDICRTGVLSLDDKIPFLMPGSVMPASTLPESSTTITRVVEPKSVYEAISEVCKIYDLGFRLLRNFDASELYFDVYSGNDMTTRQTTREPVIFSMDYDNLQNSTEFSSIEETKNVAYVFHERGSRIVLGEKVDPDVSGFERRVMYVDAKDIADTDTAEVVQDKLLQQGLEELRMQRSYSAFDGEITRGSPYQYGTHYELGDIVEMRNEDGEITYKRVTEQIFTHDQEGERSYPTLSMNSFISENTWLAQKLTKVWADYGLTEYWDTM